MSAETPAGNPGLVPFGYEDVPSAEKAVRVRRVFDQVAARYDLMNDLLSGGVHRLWKAALVDWLDPQPGQRLLDLAGGTGDVARAILARVARKARRRGAPPAEIVVCDINVAMLLAGAARPGPPDGLHRIAGDAEALPLASGSMEGVTMAFGIRNVTDRNSVLTEVRRVLRPGGRFLCLEFSQLALPGLDRLYERYSFEVIPRIGRLFAGDDQPYRYLVESIRRFPDQPRFAETLRQAGFARVAWRNLSGGIAALHSGWKV